MFVGNGSQAVEFLQALQTTIRDQLSVRAVNVIDEGTGLAGPAGTMVVISSQLGTVC
jgi:hypothetical protein